MALKISRILHAGYVFECNDTKIAFDPIFENPFSRNCFAFPVVRFDLEQVKKLKFDAVFISHFHDDHCSFESLNLLDRRTPIYMYCVFQEMLDWLRELGFEKVYSLRLGEGIQIGEFQITPHRALDADVDSIFQIQADGLNVLNVVDSWIATETLSTLALHKTWDLVLWPFQTMRELEVLAPSQASQEVEIPHEWFEQLWVLKPRYLVPSSCQFQFEEWSWFNQAFFPISYQRFADEIATILPKTPVIRINPGVSVDLTKDDLVASDSLPWVIPIGDQNVDYHFDPDLIPPPTADIARKLPPISNEQRQKALRYCEKDLLQKFASLDLSADPIYEKPFIWKLSLFDQHGFEAVFHYQIVGRKIEFLKEPMNPQWQTEIPVFKLLGALEDGESLTSMYVRIHAPDADVIEDPLLRCLFNSSFGSYQFAQLQKIQDS